VIPPPTVSLDADEVLRIAANAKRSLSLEADVIAYAYHQLARGLAQEVGGHDDNWYCFATWTSKAVGVSLNLGPSSPFWRNLALRLKVPPPLQQGLRRVMIILLGDTYLRGLSLANRSIFLEMGSFAADLWSARPQDGYQVEPQEQPARRFISSLLADADDEYLAIAKQLLTEARSTSPDSPLHSELILGANVALSAYEQARAQKVLEFVLYRPIRWLLRVSWRATLHALTPWRQRPFERFKLYAEPHQQQPPLVRALEDWWARSYTRHVLALQLPIGDIPVGRCLKSPVGFDPEAIPPPFRNERVRKLVSDFGGASLGDTCPGTRNWLSYPERMRFIVCYFRLHQRVRQLFDPPYDAEVERRLADELDEGTIPSPEAEPAAQPTASGTSTRPRARFFPLPRSANPEARDLEAVQLDRNVRSRPTEPPGTL
jgi:hypothetical protein